MSELDVNNLHLWRGEQHVLRGVGFALETGQCLQVMGANGAGKTTLLRAVCGLVPVHEGSVHWRGQDIRADLGAYHAELNYLGHDNGLKGDLTARENLRYAAAMRRRVRPDDIEGALERVGLADAADQLVRRLSAGQRRRAALARLTITGGILWVLDEPTSNLDAAGQELLRVLITGHLGEGGAVIVATHQALGLPEAQLRGLTLQ